MANYTTGDCLIFLKQTLGYQLGVFVFKKDLKVRTKGLCYFLILGVHLSNQNYDICIRRAAGQCAICWSQTTAQTAATGGGAAAGGADAAAGSFGLR